MKKFWIVKIAFFVLLAGTVMSYVTMLLWNWLVPVLFHGPMVDFWQALGLLVLSRILFHGWCGKGRGCHGGGWRGHWRKRWEEKMTNMTPEQREEFRKKWQERCGNWPPPEQKENQ